MNLWIGDIGCDCSRNGDYKFMIVGPGFSLNYQNVCFLQIFSRFVSTIFYANLDKQHLKPRLAPRWPNRVSLRVLKRSC